MRRFSLAWLLLAFVPASTLAQTPVKKPIADVWQAAYLEGAQAGYVHSRTEEVVRDGKKFYRTTTELKLTVQRNNDTIQLRMENGTDETPDGKVLSIAMLQYLGKEQTLRMEGRVEDGQLHVKVNGGQRLDKMVPWNDEVVGLYHQDQLFKIKKVQPGDSFSYQSFEPTLSAVVTTRVQVKDYEEVELGKGKKRLLRIEATPDRVVDAAGQAVPLPTMVGWLDEDLEMAKSEVDLQPLGKMTLVRTTRQEADRFDPNQRANIGLNSLIRVGTQVANPYKQRSATYRITLNGVENPEKAFATDNRQTIQKLNANTIEVRVVAQNLPPKGTPEGSPGEEYLKSSYFINCEDEKVKEHARLATSDLTDAWEKARRIEEYVHRKMENKNFTEAFATSDQVARTLEGDCTEHAVLTAAMCRAAGIPSRTALGLIYVGYLPQGPVMGFHMWAEAYVRGSWVPLDATLGQGFVGAMHLKIVDHSWHQTTSLTPLLPVMRVLGKLKIEIVSTNGQGSGGSR